MKDLRKFLVIFFIIVSLILGTMTVIASAEARAKLSARSSVLYSPDLNYFLEENNANERLPMASTTKIMTALVAIENTVLTDTVTVPREAVGIEGSSVYLKEGDTLTIADLLYSLLLRSANDAATALAITVSGDIQSFASLMNSRAESLGLSNTSFENPHGLDSDNHYTTAHDLALITSEALKNETFRKICSTYKYTFSLGDGVRTVVNHNKLLKSYEGAIGVKTGFTKKSGRCLVSAAVRDGVTLVSVTLDAPDDWRDHTLLLDSGFRRIKRVNLSDITDTAFKIPVIGGTKENIVCSANEDTGIFVLDGESLDVKIELPSYLTSPVMQGDKIGQIRIIKNNKEHLIFDIVSEDNSEKIKEKRFFNFLK